MNMLAPSAIVSPNRLTEEDYNALKARAKQIYCELPVARFTIVAYRCRISKDVVEKWAREEGWLDDRAKYQIQLVQNEAKAMRKAIGDPSALPTRLYRTIARILKQVDQISKLSPDPDVLAKLVQVIRPLYMVYNELKRELKISK